VPANCTAAHRTDQERQTNNHFKKPTEFTATEVENQNATFAAKTAHFPKTQEVEEVVRLL